MRATKEDCGSGNNPTITLPPSSGGTGSIENRQSDIDRNPFLGHQSQWRKEFTSADRPSLPP